MSVIQSNQIDVPPILFRAPSLDEPICKPATTMIPLLEIPSSLARDPVPTRSVIVYAGILYPCFELIQLPPKEFELLLRHRVLPVLRFEIPDIFEAFSDTIETRTSYFTGYRMDKVYRDHLHNCAGKYARLEWVRIFKEEE